MGARARARAPLRGAPATLERVARHPSEGRRAAPASPRTGSPRGNQTGRGARLEAAHPRATASSTCQTAAACRPRLRRRCGERRRDVLAAPPGTRMAAQATRATEPAGSRGRTAARPNDRWLRRWLHLAAPRTAPSRRATARRRSTPRSPTRKRTRRPT
jgi:hypothetical protein